MLEEMLKRAREDLLRKFPYCLNHKRKIGREELEFKMCAYHFFDGKSCKHYREIDSIDFELKYRKKRENSAYPFKVSQS